MNWYKKAQFKPISLGSYLGNQMGIYFNGRGPYYYIVEPPIYKQIEKLLKNNNFSEVFKILKKIADKNKEIENKQKQLF